MTTVLVVDAKKTRWEDPIRAPRKNLKILVNMFYAFVQSGRKTRRIVT